MIHVRPIKGTRPSLTTVLSLAQPVHLKAAHFSTAILCASTRHCSLDHGTGKEGRSALTTRSTVVSLKFAPESALSSGSMI